ncbi:glycosyltransferase family 2 protein [Aeromonas veronii]
MESNIKLSICICTFNREPFLRSCLESLISLINGQDDIELIVIDNNSVDGTMNYITSLSTKYDFLRYFKETKQGLSHARNRAKVEFLGEWLAFVDDDAVVSDNWLTVVLKYIAQSQYDILGGIYEPWYRDGKVDWYKDIYGSNKAWLTFNNPTELKDKCVSGGNMILSREVLKKINFDTDKGMIAYKRSYGEETFFQNEARKLGFKILFIPDLIIYHYVPLSKQNKMYFFERARIQGEERINNKGISKSRWLPLAIIMKLVVSITFTLIKNLYGMVKGCSKPYNLYIEVYEKFIYYKFFLKSVTVNEKK